jgi:tRNA-dihydrouridine synthase A
MSESGAQEIERLSVAPMMEITDRHYRWMVRQIAPKTRLFTEMITTWALIHGRRLDLLDFDAAERPLALQLGGDDPAALATCARIAEDLGYDEVNLNVGCPSPRVQAGCFGVSLMGRPERVAECVAAMRAVVRVPVTVKHRIGFDELDAYEDMLRFVDVVAAAGCRHFYVHARKAWLSGLSPKDNRNVPPLRYADVHRLKRERPGLWIAINGGLRSEDEITSQLEHVDGVMVGRGAAEDPMSLHALERVVFGACSGLQDPMHVAERMVAYAERASVAGVAPRHVIRHALPLLQGRPGARQWRRAITEGLGAGRGPELLTEAIRAYRGGLGERRGSDAGVHVD